MDGHPDLLKYTAKRFIKLCRAKFQWRDLSSSAIMDVGCGEEGNCGKQILEKFPDVKSILGIDSDRKIVRYFRLNNATKMECVYADIERRESLQKYEGQMDKVISSGVFHQLMDKVEAFRNVYHLLKPGGEAAVLLLKESLLFKWLTEMLKKNKWKDAFKCQYIEDSLKSGFGADQYQEIVKNIGFQVVDCKEEEISTPYLSDQICKDALHEMSEIYFNIPSGVLEEFKEDCLQVLLKLSARDDEGNPCYRATELSLLLSKPTEVASSKTKEIT